MKKLSFLSVLGILVLLLSACGSGTSGNPTPGAGGGGGSTQPAPAANGALANAAQSAYVLPVGFGNNAPAPTSAATLTPRFGADISPNQLVGYTVETSGFVNSSSGTTNFDPSHRKGGGVRLGVVRGLLISFTAQDLSKCLITTQTATPTAVSSTVPTAMGTAPTSVSTAVPSAVPTAITTAEPSTVPTTISTAVPSAAPSIVPTSEPTLAATTLPTSEPSMAPTSVGTTTATAVSSAVPSSVPTGVMTATPTALHNPGPNCTNPSMVWIVVRADSRYKFRFDRDFVAIPWENVTLNPAHRILRVNVTSAAFSKAPTFGFSALVWNGNTKLDWDKAWRDYWNSH